MSISFIVAAAGRGKRLGGVDKALLPLGGRPVIWHVLRAISQASDLREIVVVGRAGILPALRDAVAPFAGVCRVVAGGDSRAESVHRGLQALSEAVDLVAIHDAARPLVSADLIRRVCAAAIREGAAVPALPVTDTIKRVRSGDAGAERVDNTVDRQHLRRVQTPQVFAHKMLVEAYRSLEPGDRARVTDDASLIELAGGDVRLVEGDERNIKITTWADYVRVRAEMRGIGCGGGRLQCRVGVGYDSHRFSAGRKLRLGGVTIPYPVGLSGHSDADAVLHAISDALLGACGLGDIGHHFPPGDERFRDASSADLLHEVVCRMARDGWRPHNIDVTIVAEKPRMAPYIESMRREIASVVAVDEEAVSVKASTAERMGAIGRGEGIASIAVCTVIRGIDVCEGAEPKSSD